MTATMEASVGKRGRSAAAGVGRSSESVAERAFREHNVALVKFLRSRLGHRQEHAEDIAQETFYRMSRYQSEGNTPEQPRALLFQIARNLLIDFHRSGKVQHWDEHVDIQGEELVSGAPSHERVISGREDLERLQQIVQSLPPRCQEAFVLSRFQHMKYRDIAERLGISVSMVEKHIKNAFKIIDQNMRA